MLELQIGMENPFKKPSKEGAICEMTPDGLLLNIYLRNITTIKDYYFYYLILTIR